MRARVGAQSGAPKAAKKSEALADSGSAGGGGDGLRRASATAAGASSRSEESPRMGEETAALGGGGTLAVSVLLRRAGDRLARLARSVEHFDDVGVLSFASTRASVRSAFRRG